ncbi:MAG: DUF1761 domain-containing protein [Pseudomonadota bacterium]
MEQQINFLGAFLAALSTFVLGALWYSPALFGKSWMRLSGLSEEAVASANKLKMIGVSAVWSLLGAFAFAAFLGEAKFGPSIAAGVTAGLFWVSGAFAINYAFEQKPFGLWLVNGGYHTIQFTLFGAIIGAMNGF